MIQVTMRESPQNVALISAWVIAWKARYLKGEISVCRPYEKAFLSQTISLISRFEEIGEYFPSKTIIIPVSFSKTTIQSIVIQRWVTLHEWKNCRRANRNLIPGARIDTWVSIERKFQFFGANLTPRIFREKRDLGYTTVVCWRKEVVWVRVTC